MKKSNLKKILSIALMFTFIFGLSSFTSAQAKENTALESNKVSQPLS